MDIALPMCLLFATLLAGVPVAWCMAGSGAVGILLTTSSPQVLYGALSSIPYNQGVSFSLLTLPMFILLAFLLSRARISDDLFDAVAKWTGSVRGGLSVSTVFAGAIFGSMSGASVASATVLSKVAAPSMKRYDYDDRLSAGAIAVASTLSTLIPPSIVLIIYGIATETSIGQLLVAGLVPGVLMAMAAAVTILIWVSINPHMAPRGLPVPLTEKMRSLMGILPSVLLIAVMVGSLYLGIASPSEVGAVGAFAALVLGLAMRRLSLRSIAAALEDTVRSSAMIFVLLIGASIFAQYLTLSRIPTTVLEAVESWGLGATGILVAVGLIYILGCAFMDELPFLLLTLPITFPLMTNAGFDPVWYGVFAILLINFGLIAPPVGMISFVVSGTSGISLGKVYEGVSVMLIGIVAVIALVSIFPELVLWLPERMR